LSADHFLKRLDKIGEALGNRPVAYRRGMDEFQLARCIAFIIARGQSAFATADDVKQARYYIDLFGLPNDYGSPGFRNTQARTA